MLMFPHQNSSRLIFNWGIVFLALVCFLNVANAGTVPPTEVVFENKALVSLPETGPLVLTLDDAVMLALENNPALMVEKLNPAIAQTVEDQQKAVFDPTLSATLNAEQTAEKRQVTTTQGLRDTDSKSYEAEIALEQFFPSGTTILLEGSQERSNSSLYSNDLVTSRLGLTVTQALLNGRGRDVNLVDLRQAAIDVKISAYELRGFSEALIADIETAYWQYALALRRIEIVAESLKVAQQQLDETREMIDVGSLAEAELAAAQAEVALQRQGQIDAESNLETARITLLRLINPPLKNFWNRPVKLALKPSLPQEKLDPVDDHIAVAIRMRPELNQAKLDIHRNKLEIVQTKNGLLPQLDLFITLGKSGYANTFGGSISDIGGNNFDVSAGMTYSFPIKNRSAKATHRQAELNFDQTKKAYANLVRLVEMDVRTAYIEIERTKAQITASTATRTLQEEKLRIETEKFKVGRSTTFLVAQAQRDLLAARIAEVSALIAHLIARTDFYRLEGSLLLRRKISAPGKEPVKLANMD